MSFSDFFSDISDFLSGVNPDEDAQSVADEVQDVSEVIQENNETNLTGQGATLPTPQEPLGELDNNVTDEDNDTSPPPEDDVPIVNAQDNICTNNPDDTSCDKKIVDAYFAKKGKQGISTNTTHKYKITNSKNVGFETSQVLIDKIAKEIKDAITLDSADIVLSMAGIDKVGKIQVKKDLTFNAKYGATDLPITYTYNSNLYDISTDEKKQNVADTTQEYAIKGFRAQISSIKTALEGANQTKFEIGDTLTDIQIEYKQKITSTVVNVATITYTFEDVQKLKEGTADRKERVYEIVNEINELEKAKTTNYFTNSKAVDKVMPEDVYGAGVTGHPQTEFEVELFKYIPKYIKINKIGLGAKVYLVAKTENFAENQFVKFKIFENGDKLLKDYVNENKELPFLRRIDDTIEITEITGQVITANVDEPDTGDILEGMVAIEIALRPTDTNFQNWKNKFRVGTVDKEDKLYLKASSTLYSIDEEFLIDDELVVINGVKGYVYKRNGKFLKRVTSDNVVYAVDNVSTSSSFINPKKLEDVTHTKFQIISKIVKLEGTTDETDEYLWIAHTANNSATASNVTMYSKLNGTYSSVSRADKTALGTTINTEEANAARAGVISVFLEEDDPTDNAVLWDGTDFLAWGLNSPYGNPHAKFRQYYNIQIFKSIYVKYRDTQLEKYTTGRVRYSGRYYTLPSAVFTDTNNWTTGKFNYNTGYNNTYRIEATGSVGESIFWKKVK